LAALLMLQQPVWNYYASPDRVTNQPQRDHLNENLAMAVHASLMRSSPISWQSSERSDLRHGAGIVVRECVWRRIA